MPEKISAAPRTLSGFLSEGRLQVDFYSPEEKAAVTARLGPVIAVAGRSSKDAREGQIRNQRSPEWVAARLRGKKFSELARKPNPVLLAGLGLLDRGELQDLGAELRRKGGCHLSSLMHVVAARMEVMFPSEDAVKGTLALHSKVSGCGASDNRERSLFRLAMIRIWRGEQREARKPLQMLRLPRVDPEFRVRALYWSYRVEGNPSYRRQLLREFPLSLHALLLDGNPPADYPDDSPVETRSRSRRPLNLAVEEAEVLLRAERKEEAARRLHRVVRHALRERAGFRLYYSYLLGLAGQSRLKYWILSDLLRDPALWSRAALQLLFPLRNDVLAGLDVESDEALLLSLIRQESQFNPDAVSHAGAVGLMQIMPATAERMGFTGGDGLFDPEENVRLGTRYLHGLLSQYDDVELALAAYNAGPHRVDDWLKRYVTVDRALFLDLIPFRETREYVAFIARNYWWYRRLYSEIRSRRLVSSEPVFSVFGQSSSPTGQ